MSELKRLVAGILKESGNLKKLLEESEEIRNGNFLSQLERTAQCECCEGEGEVNDTRAIWDHDAHIVSYEETGKLVPCPECRKDYYN